MAVIGILVVSLGFIAGSLFYSRLQQEAEAQRVAQVDLIHHELESIDSFVQEQTKSAIRVLKDEGQALGPASLGEIVKVGDKNVPNLMFGNSPQANNYAVVDKVKELMGGTATLFVKSGSEFVRVSTNVQKDNGTRATGTVLDAQGKAYAAINQGASFYGTVNILDKPYITIYEPIKNQAGEVVGVWYVGYQLASYLEKMGQRIPPPELLKTSFFAVVDGKNTVISKSSEAPADVLEISVV